MKSIAVKLVPGRQLASGTNQSCRYPGGTIRLQQQAFLANGLDTSECYPGTLNFETPDKKTLFPDVPSHAFAAEWFPGKTETFLIAPITISHGGKSYKGLLYQPSLIREIGPKQAPRSFEVLAPKIDGIKYGDEADVTFDESQCALITGEQAIDKMRAVQGELGSKLNLSQETACARLLELATLKYRVALQFPDAAPLLHGVGMPVVNGSEVNPDRLAVDVARLAVMDPKAPQNVLDLSNELLSSVEHVENERKALSAPVTIRRLPAIPVPALAHEPQ